MSGRDPIASATLAQLYIAQGHVGKATKVLAEVLSADPVDGAALHLRSRLNEHRPTLSLAVDDREIHLGWQGAPNDLHALVACFGGDRDLRRVFVTSARCSEAFGQCTRNRPWTRGTAVACLGRVGDRGFEVITTARPISWG